MKHNRWHHHIRSTIAMLIGGFVSACSETLPADSEASRRSDAGALTGDADQFGAASFKVGDCTHPDWPDLECLR